MRVGMQVSGSAIGRVFTQPVAPPRRFRGVIDTALTLALGSVCAFALTLGPAPLNTVAASSAAAASFAGHFDPAPESALLPAEVYAGDSSEQQPRGESQTTPSPSASTTQETVAQSPVGSSAPVAPPGAAKKAANAAQPHAPLPYVPTAPGPPPGVTASEALTIVETFRTASGLGSFVSVDACADPTIHITVPVTPPALLPPGLASKTLAPDPASATVSGQSGALFVTVYACE